jgi:hypothetical protein
VTQVFTFGAVFALRRRKAALLEEPRGDYNA